jgi:hypothetical protein
LAGIEASNINAVLPGDAEDRRDVIEEDYRGVWTYVKLAV